MSWDSPEYELEGESGGGGSVIGMPADAYFEDSDYGAKLRLVIKRSNPELHPNAKPEVSWTYSISGAKERENWSILDNGMRIVHAGGKSVNAGTDLGKLFKSVKAHLPYVEGFDVCSAESWRALSKLGDIEWGWLEEAKRKEDPPGSGKWVVDPDKEPKRTMIVVGYLGGAGEDPTALAEVFDVALIPEDMRDALKEAARAADGGDHNLLLAEIAKVPGALQVKPIMDALSDAGKATALKEALVGF